MQLLTKMLREPLLHFLAIGIGLFILFRFINGPAVDRPDRIVVTQGQVELLVQNFSRAWMRPPSEREMKGLVDNYIRDEVYYREAIALGLDKDDDLIRRRMRQKLEFILEDIAALIDPSDEDLAVFMSNNTERFRQPPKVTLQQVYLSPDKRQDINVDAAKLLTRLRSGESPDQLGDPIMLEAGFPLMSQTDIERRFGDEFARQVVSLPEGVWSGPIISGFGGHLVLVSKKVDGRMPKLAEVEEAVRREWLLEQRRELQENTFRKLLDNYEVVIELPRQKTSTTDAGEASGTATETQ